MKLNPDYVLFPFLKLLGNLQNNVLMGLRLVEKIDTFPEPTPEELQLFQIYFNGHITEIAESKSLFKYWLLKNGFEDIHSAIRITMERLYVLKKIEKDLKQKPQYENKYILELQAKYLKQANKEKFPNLLTKINKLLKEPLSYQNCIESINKARNCYVHRNGIVGKDDINNKSMDKLEILGIKFKYFYKVGEDEIPVILGNPSPKNASLMLGAKKFKIQFNKGEKIDFTLKQFVDIMNTCIFIKADIDEKLK